MRNIILFPALVDLMIPQKKSGKHRSMPLSRRKQTYDAVTHTIWASREMDPGYHINIHRLSRQTGLAVNTIKRLLRKKIVEGVIAPNSPPEKKPRPMRRGLSPQSQLVRATILQWNAEGKLKRGCWSAIARELQVDGHAVKPDTVVRIATNMRIRGELK